MSSSPPAPTLRQRFWRLKEDLRQRFRRLKENLREGTGDPSAKGRARAWLHFMLFDHAVLRIFWTNFAEIAPGVYRAAHPSAARLSAWARRGVRSVVNLRGAASAPHYRDEHEACRKLGLTLHDVEGLTARQAPSREALEYLIATMRRAEKPFLLHCKSGADRSSLAAAIYLLAIEGASISAAREQMSPRFLHFRWTRTGILDAILDAYGAAHRDTGAGFEDWLARDYDAAAIQADFDASRG
jgi:protein tyrosine/serine phosphatase